MNELETLILFARMCAETGMHGDDFNRLLENSVNGGELLFSHLRALRSYVKWIENSGGFTVQVFHPETQSGKKHRMKEVQYAEGYQVAVGSEQRFPTLMDALAIGAFDLKSDWGLWIADVGDMPVYVIDKDVRFVKTLEDAYLLALENKQTAIYDWEREKSIDVYELDRMWKTELSEAGKDSRVRLLATCFGYDVVRREFFAKLEREIKEGKHD